MPCPLLDPPNKLELLPDGLIAYDVEAWPFESPFEVEEYPFMANEEC